MGKSFEEVTTSTEEIYDGRIISLRVDEVTLPNGKQTKRELITHPGAVAIIGITAENRIILVEQYRKALERSLFEIPAGKIEKGEKPEHTALRELEEETGYTATKLHYLQRFATSPGFADEIIYLYVAEGLQKLERPVLMDDDEFVNVHEVTLAEADRLIDSEEIYDAKTAFAVQWWKIHQF